jgi:hypothetical protein
MLQKNKLEWVSVMSNGRKPENLKVVWAEFKFGSLASQQQICITCAGAFLELKIYANGNVRYFQTTFIS